MSKPADVPQRTLEECVQHIELLQQQHQQIACALCTTRLVRNMGLLHEHPTHGLPGLHRIRLWLAGYRYDVIPPVPTTDEESPIIIIDAEPIEMGEEKETKDG